MTAKTLQSIYRSTNANTLAMWEDNAGIGEIRSEHYYDPVKLALATGIQPPIPFMVSRLLDELKNVTGSDPLADIQPAHGFHFTFLPLTQPCYKVNEPLPENMEQLRQLWREFHGRKIVIRRLRLVALPSQLLLAGIPDEPAIALRQSFCEKLLKTPWRQELLLRHNHSPLPAPFWHSTLLRYRAAFLPAAVRQFFIERQDCGLGEVAGEMALARINYNWTKYYPVEM